MSYYIKSPIEDIILHFFQFVKFPAYIAKIRLVSRQIFDEFFDSFGVFFGVVDIA